MEKKTIGQFISALRKASGMTQKDLAAKLNVSDKAVSRWERDECAPDLALIPVIADIFSVTADELLRGERRPVNSPESSVNTEENTFSAKSQKQIKYLLNKALTNYKIESLVTVALAIVGLITALIFNSFSKALFGLGVGIIIYIVAAVCLTAFTVNTYSKMSVDELDEDNINPYKKSVVYTAWFVASAIFVIFCATLPLAIVGDAYLGLDIHSLLPLGIIYAVIGAVICVIARFILTGVLIRHGIVIVNDTLKCNRRLITKISIILAVVLAVTCIVQVTFNNIAESEMFFLEGTQFDDYNDFKEYMETPKETQINNNVYYNVMIISDNDEETFEEYEIFDENGNMLCRYVWRNNDVCRIDYSQTDDYLPITVYTSQDYFKHNNIMNYINIAIALVYVIEIVTAVMIYRKKRVK